MTLEQTFTIDTLDIVPDNSICYIQCPSIDDDSKIKELFVPSEFNYCDKINLTSENKQKLKDIIQNEPVVDNFHNMTIKHNDITLMEAYDGNVIGIFSKKTKCSTIISGQVFTNSARRDFKRLVIIADTDNKF